jgi:hypothetical protein
VAYILSLVLLWGVLECSCLLLTLAFHWHIRVMVFKVTL